MDTKRFEQRLRQERESVAASRDPMTDRLAVSQGESGGELSLADQHPADAATETAQRELDLMRERMFDLRIERINAALERVAAGTYGKCQVCGKEIPEERLEIIPETAYCVQDAAREEGST